MSDDLKCNGVLIIGGGAEENADVPYQYQVHAECDGPRNCGFHEHIPEHDGDAAWWITSDDFAAIQERHLAHARR